MPIPLSIDLRKRVISAIDDGMKVAEAAASFRVCLRVVYEWLELRNETGSLLPKEGYQNGHSHKITDWNVFKAFAEANKYCTIKEMTEKWNAQTNDTVSKSVIQRGLKKIGFTFKKKPSITLKQTLRSAKSS